MIRGVTRREDAVAFVPCRNGHAEEIQNRRRDVDVARNLRDPDRTPQLARQREQPRDADVLFEQVEGVPEVAGVLACPTMRTPTNGRCSRFWRLV